MRRAFAVFILLVLAQLPAYPGRTQELDTATLELVDQPVWHGPDDSLQLRLRISNTGPSELSGFRLRIGVYDRVQSRSELHESFDAAPFFEPSSFPIDFDLSVPAGGETTVTVTDPVSALATVQSAREGGVFPLTVTLQAGDETPLASLTTALLYFPEDVERPLNAVTLVPLNELPARAPDGTFDTLDESWPLEVATQEAGWLQGLVSALVEATAPPPASPPTNRRGRPNRHSQVRPPRRADRPQTELRLAVAPVPRLLDELADMSDGFKRAGDGEVATVERSAPAAAAAAQTLGGLRTLIGREGVQAVLVPYAFPDLPSLSLEDLAAQLDSAEETLDRTLGAEAGFSRRWLFPPAGRIDASTLSDLRALQSAEHTFSSEAAFVSDVEVTPGCPEPFASFTCPVSMEAGDASAQGFVSDSKLQDLLGDVARAEGSSAIEMQRFWADTVQVWAELPGTRDRVVYFALPTTWHPSPAAAQSFFAALKRAPWLNTVTPDEALLRGQPHPRTMTDFHSGTPTSAPSDSNLLEAADRVKSLEALIPGSSRASAQRQILQRLHTNLLVARSRVWLDEELISRGLSYASDTIDEADRHFDGVQIGGAEEIALTSQRAPIQLLLQNQNSHPVAVTVYLESEGLELQDYVLDEVVPAERTRQIQVDAQTRASGIFPLRVSVQTSDGYEIAQTAIRIRSTEFNEIALGVTIGALLFLIAFYVWRTVRKRAAPAEGTVAA